MTLRKIRLFGPLLCLLVAASLAGCGRKSPLDAPNAAATDQNQTSESQKSAQAETAKNSQFYSPIEKHSSFILDPLLK